jgi:hypothetical protein
MTQAEQNTRRTWRLIMVTGFLSLLAVGFVQVTLNAAARAAADPPASGAKLEGEIEDDPTVAPDSEESADNNVSFPIDI